MELFLGVVVSLVSQYSKKLFGTGEYQTLATVALLAFVGSGVYTWLSHAGYWGSFQQILITAGAFYAFIISRFPKASNPPESEV